MQHAYGQVPLDEETTKQCKFQIVGEKTTGTYRFITGFYGLTVMPTEFQKAMDNDLASLPHTFLFHDDILVVTNGTEENHYKAVTQVLERLDKRTYD